MTAEICRMLLSCQRPNEDFCTCHTDNDLVSVVSSVTVTEQRNWIYCQGQCFILLLCGLSIHNTFVEERPSLHEV